MKPAPEHYRVDQLGALRMGMTPEWATGPECGNNGMFMVPCGGHILRCTISDGMGWEHVCVSLRHRCPTWEEMCFIKSQFWGDEEVVMQLHPKKSEYVNWHPYCLHLWRPTAETIPAPPSILVGPKRP